MQSTNSLAQQYHLSHHHFIDAYQRINEYVSGLYILPQKMVEDAGMALDTYFFEDLAPGPCGQAKISYDLVVDFMDQMDDFTKQTIQLFNEHRKHVEDTRRYVRKASALKTKYSIGDGSGGPEEYSELIPDLIKLLRGLRQIKEQADSMIRRMENLQLKWHLIKGELIRA